MIRAEALDLKNPLWAFALDFYGRPRVAQACLAIQDTLDADIVELLVILYAWSERGISLSEIEGAELRNKMHDWREVAVLPLRQVRRALKEPRPYMPHVSKEILRDQVKRAELLAEQIQIAWASEWLADLRAADRPAELDPMPAWFLTSQNGGPMSDRCTRACSIISQTAIDMKR